MLIVETVGIDHLAAATDSCDGNRFHQSKNSARDPIGKRKDSSTHLVIVEVGRTPQGKQSSEAGQQLAQCMIVAPGDQFLPEPAHTWLDGAAFNLGWLVVYAVSTALLWNGGRSPVASRDEAA